MRYSSVSKRSVCVVIGIVFMGISLLMACTPSSQPSQSTPTSSNSLLSPTQSSSSSLPGQLQSPQPVTLSWVGCDVVQYAFLEELAAAYTAKTGIQIRVEGGGATRGIRDPAALKADMGGTCRHVLPIPEEGNVSLVPVGWDALVVIVNPANPVAKITLEQLKEIWTGKITNWRDLGGPDHPINLIIRDGKISGVDMMLRELVFANRDQDFSASATVAPSSGPVEQMVEKDAWAVGVSGISSAKRRQVKTLRLEGVEPTYENIANGTYSLFRPLYLVISKGSPNKAAVNDFVTFALSDGGQEIVKQAGTVTLEDGAGLWSPYREKMLKLGVTMGDF